jgi:hypothetical protein
MNLWHVVGFSAAGFGFKAGRHGTVERKIANTLIKKDSGLDD